MDQPTVRQERKIDTAASTSRFGSYQIAASERAISSERDPISVDGGMVFALVGIASNV